MSDETRPLTLGEAIEGFFEIPLEEFPSDRHVQRQALVAEAIRIALVLGPQRETGWKIMHIHSLRSWVLRKLRALIPEIESDPADENLFLETLKDGVGANLVFLGDVMDLARGYYAPAPTRIVPIDNSSCLLVSGLPTAVIRRSRIPVRITGISRMIQAAAPELESAFGIPVQLRESYIGMAAHDDIHKATTGDFLAGESRLPWFQAGDWICYQGNRGRYGFEYNKHYYSVRSPLGVVSLWQDQQEFGHVEDWLRIRHEGNDEMIHVPGRFRKHFCLLLDTWDEKPRKVVFREGGNGETVVQAKFAPPAAQTRWIHALGGRWLGSSSGWIQWSIPSDSSHSAVDVFRNLPIAIDQGEGA